MYNRKREHQKRKRENSERQKDALTYLIQVNDLLMFNEDY